MSICEGVRPSVSPSVCPYFVRSITLKLCKANMKSHRQIDLIEEKCSAQEPACQASYFKSYCSLLIFLLKFCQEHNFKTMQGINIKLHRQIYLIAVQRNHNSKLHTFEVIALCSFSFLNFVRSITQKSIQATDLNFHGQIDLIEKKCSAQEP